MAFHQESTLGQKQQQEQLLERMVSFMEFDYNSRLLTLWTPWTYPYGQPASEEYSIKIQPGSFFVTEVHDQIKLMKQAQQGPADESSDDTDASFPQINDQDDDSSPFGDQQNLIEHLDDQYQAQRQHCLYFSRKYMLQGARKILTSVRGLVCH